MDLGADLEMETGGLYYYLPQLVEEVAEGGSKSSYYLNIYWCSPQL
jgi:hypothetical protein